MKKNRSGSNLENLLHQGEFVVTAELGPPRGANKEEIEKKVELLRGTADAFNITDCQTAVVRMSSIATGSIIANLGLEPIVQMTCRDRNRIAMQSDILGAAATGAKNILCLTGDHQKFGDHPTSRGVFDLDSIQLIQMVKVMRDEKRFQSGEELEGEPKLFIGAAANPFADPFHYRAVRLGKKVKAGADFIQTQIVYNVERFKEWMKFVRDMGIHENVYILAGVAPLKSAGMAKYMKNSVPGMEVPDELIARMVNAKKGSKKEEGIKICVEIMEQIREIEGVAGVHIMAIEWEEAVTTISKAAGLLPRPVPGKKTCEKK